VAGAAVQPPPGARQRLSALTLAGGGPQSVARRPSVSGLAKGCQAQPREAPAHTASSAEGDAALAVPVELVVAERGAHVLVVAY
jgi:hypothetical protein